MPLYLFYCMKCGSQRSDMRTVDERHDGPKCDTCGKQMTLQITPVAGVVKNPAAPKS